MDRDIRKPHITDFTVPSKPPSRKGSFSGMDLAQPSTDTAVPGEGEFRALREPPEPPGPEDTRVDMPIHAGETTPLLRPEAHSSGNATPKSGRAGLQGL